MAWEPGRASVLVASSLGSMWQVHRVDLANGRATHLLSGRGLARRLRPGDPVSLSVRPDQVHGSMLGPNS